VGIRITGSRDSAAWDVLPKVSKSVIGSEFGLLEAACRMHSAAQYIAAPMSRPVSIGASGICAQDTAKMSAVPFHVFLRG
jgi:hypothetical protein